MDKIRYLHLASFLVCIASAIMLVVTDFGGLFYYGYSVNTWVWINASGLAAALLIPLAILFVLLGIIELQEVINVHILPKPVNTRILLILDLILVTVIAVGGLVLGVVGIIDEATWWFDAGFYGPLIGGLLWLLFYFLIDRFRIA